MKIFYMKRLSYLILFLLAVFWACNTSVKSNQPPDKNDSTGAASIKPKVNIDDTLHHLVGNIDGKIPIVMNIFIRGNHVSGSMYYQKVGKYIFLKGNVDQNGQMNIKGFLRNGTFTDQFSGTYNNEVYEGKWTNGDKTKKLDFQLKRLDTFWVLVDSFKYQIYDSVLFDSNWVHYRNEVEIFYPKAFPVPRAGYKITHVLMKKVLGSTPDFNALKDSMIQDREQWHKELEQLRQEGDRYGFGREYSQLVSVSYEKHLLLVVTESLYLFDGGAHGMPIWHDYNFDMYTSKLLTINDVFSAPKNLIVKNLIIPALDKYFRENYNESVEEAVFDIDKIGLPEGFYFSDQGMGFYYEPYSIAAFVYGFPRFEVPYDSLKPYLSDFVKKRFGLQ